MKGSLKELFIGSNCSVIAKSVAWLIESVILLSNIITFSSSPKFNGILVSQNGL